MMGSVTTRDMMGCVTVASCSSVHPSTLYTMFIVRSYHEAIHNAHDRGGGAPSRDADVDASRVVLRRHQPAAYDSNTGYQSDGGAINRRSAAGYQSHAGHVSDYDARSYQRASRYVSGGLRQAVLFAWFAYLFCLRLSHV